MAENEATKATKAEAKESTTAETRSGSGSGSGTPVDELFTLLKSSRSDVAAAVKKFRDRSQGDASVSSLREISELWLPHAYAEDELVRLALRLKGSLTRPVAETVVRHDLARTLLSSLVDTEDEDPFQEAQWHVWVDLVAECLEKDGKAESDIAASLKQDQSRPAGFFEELKNRIAAILAGRRSAVSIRQHIDQVLARRGELLSLRALSLSEDSFDTLARWESTTQFDDRRAPRYRPGSSSHRTSGRRSEDDYEQEYENGHESSHRRGH